MKPHLLKTPALLIAAATALCLSAALFAEGEAGKKRKAKPEVEEKDRVTVEVARDRAKVMHDVYSATLDVIHHRYFHGDRAVIPARAMEDIFEEMNHQSKVEARWIAVNATAMSIDHEPESDFEKRAVREIVGGKSEFEAVEDGYYRRAGAISLGGGCMSCHGGFFRAPSTGKKFAGLVISIPVKK